MKRIFLILCMGLTVLSVTAQPARRRTEQQKQQQTGAGAITTRARISFPTAQEMSEDVVWRRDIYRELKLTEEANAGLYYPTEPIGSQMNLFTYIFKLMLHRDINCYEYRLDGNELFTDSARIKPLQFLDNYKIYYERRGKGIYLDNSDIPSAEVKGYYIKESAYYDQGTATFHRKVVALCPILYREDDFGEGETKYPLFWVKYDEVSPYLAKQTMMTSDLNNAATMSVDDYFTTNMYDGKIYKTTNMLGRTLAQYCPTDSAMTAEQRKIERELKDFEKNIFGDQTKRDSLDSVKTAQDQSDKKVKRSRASRRSGESKTTVRRSRRSSSGSSAGSARVTVRRERH